MDAPFQLPLKLEMCERMISPSQNCKSKLQSSSSGTLKKIHSHKYATRGLFLFHSNSRGYEKSKWGRPIEEWR